MEGEQKPRPKPVKGELLDRTPPRDLDAERAVIGSVVLDPRRMSEVAAVLSASDFYAEAHKILWENLVAMEATGRIDITLLASRLRENKQIDAIGGTAYLAQVMHSVPVAHHAAHYARTVTRLAAHRRVIQAGLDLVRTGYDAEDEPQAALDRAEAILHAARPSQNGKGPHLIEQAAIDALELVHAVYERRRRMGLSTGIETWDTEIGGLFPGELIVVAARPGMGKTSLAMQIAYWFAARGLPVLFVSLEMSARTLALRLLCSLAGVSSQAIRTAAIGEQDLERLSGAGQPMAKIPFWLFDAPETTATTVRREARRLHRDDLWLVVVDYVQRLTPEDRRVPRHEQVGQISAALKALSVELNVPVLALAQLNREIEKEAKPRIGHLGESARLEHDADVVVFIVWDEKEADDPQLGVKATLHVLKNRNGITGRIPVTWYPAETKFDG